MGLIYKITNVINSKIYIGKTISTLSDRFSKHKYEAIHDENASSHLHNAMRKYGIDNFIIEQIEECDNNILSERECYWIKYYNSYFDNSIGYNDTPGGEGCPKYDKDKILALWNQGLNQTEIAHIMNCERHTIKRYIQDSTSEEERLIKKQKNASKTVYKIDIHTNQILDKFASIKEASISEGCSASMIGLVCNKQRKLRNKTYTYIKEVDYNESE